ncbi:MAG: spore coat protein CotJB [Oscillospiraceae bacterium]|nr:spore coat protein CotJB [Oscillospiraceae bacterium]
MTEGPVLRKLLGFAIPTILGNLCMQLYNLVDSVVVGNFVGTQALAAVGASFSLMMLFNALFMGVSMGSQIVVSQTFGAKNYKQLRKEAIKEYTEMYGPICKYDVNVDNYWDWVNKPWPWDGECGRSCGYMKKDFNFL